MFTGFNGITYPEYEVNTPQNNLKFMIRTLNVMEEEHLKGSFVTPSKITDHLNQCIFKAITQKPKEITDFQSFLKNVTLKDREALLYGLYHITYEEIRNYDVTCSHCKKEFPVTIKASSAFDVLPYKGENILDKRVKVELPVYKGVSAFIKQPTLFDEVDAVSKVSGSNVDVITQTLIIDKFHQIPVENQPEKNVDNREDIVDAFFTLPPRDRKVIHDAYVENFGRYGITMKMKVFCRYCAEEDIVDIDMVENFFRMVYSV